MVVNLTETLVIKSDVNELAKVATITEEICERCGLIEDEIDDIAIAVTEAVNNAIKHGNKEDSTKSIEIVFQIETERIKIRIKDEGKGFQLEKVKDPRKNENLLKDDGRGILIMKTLMDEVKVLSGTEGNVLQLVKNISRNGGN
ncbi:MAG: ATP-binding protein [Candidatus Marinimicrobia bacterium]|nr:ATP-binding protein [Candidatus Neomarinimicrobiota bacterium]MCH7954834.1 ATP-binding protein [Candidatus Neomarinimicrobiota bacterium]